MKYNILIVFLSISLNAYTQPSIIKGKSKDKTSNVGLSSEELSIASNAYLKMIDTEIYIEYQNKTKALAKKIGKVLTLNAFNENMIEDKDTFLKWLEKNLKKTNFKTYDEAKELVEDGHNSSEKLKKENSLLFELMKKATPEQIREISQPFLNKVKSELGN
jgi:hypothetical protein